MAGDHYTVGYDRFEGAEYAVIEDDERVVARIPVWMIPGIVDGMTQVYESVEDA